MKHSQPNFIDHFWKAFKTAHPDQSPASDRYLAWSFGDNQEMADHLLQLVLNGSKTATCALLSEYGDTPLPKVGEFNIILSGSGKPACITQTIEVEIVPFNAVSADFAEAEGESTFADWKRIHWEYFSRVSSTPPSEDIQIPT